MTKWKILNQTDVSPSPWFPVVKDAMELPNGKVVEYYKSQLANVAMVVPITTNNEVVFVKQYKHGVGEICIEFPAGRIEKGQTAAQTAVRELQEETGMKIAEEALVKLVELWTEPSKSSVHVTGFLVKDVELVGDQDLEETENIEIIKVPLAELDAFVKAGNIHASDTLALIGFLKIKFADFF